MKIFKKRDIVIAGEGAHMLADAVGRIADPSRRSFLQRNLSLGGLALLTGCSTGDEDSIGNALARIDSFNDRVQGLLFDPNRLAPTYPDSMITRPFPFNAY
jgi:hypothetical protein